MVVFLTMAFLFGHQGVTVFLHGRIYQFTITVTNFYSKGKRIFKNRVTGLISAENVFNKSDLALLSRVHV